MKDIEEKIKELSVKDTKNLSQLGLKLMEEVGELAKVLLPYDNVDGTRHRFVDRTALVDGVVDVILSAKSILYKLKIHEDKYDAMMLRKVYYWEKLQSLPPFESFPYEIHITVAQAESHAKFIEDCTAIGVKPVVLDLHTKASGVIRDVMTSSTLIGTNRTVMEEVNRITEELEERGYRVVRQKIETVPWHPHTFSERTDDNYYEAHIPVTIDDSDGAYEDLKYLSKRHPGTHLSQNVLKKHNNGTCIVMLTMRHNACTHEEFLKKLGLLRGELTESGYDIGQKNIVEWAIYDNNTSHDDEWVEGE